MFSARTATRRLSSSIEHLQSHHIAGLILRALGSYGRHADGIYAGAIGFFGLLSLFPLVILLVTLFGAIVRSADAMTLVISDITGFIPGSGDLISSVIQAATSATPAVLGIGTAGLLWSSMGVFMTLGYALNRTWNVKRDRNILIQYVIAASLALSVGLIVVVSLALSSLANAVFFFALPLANLNGLAVVISNGVDFVVVWFGAAFLYRFLPNVRVEWHDVLVPALLVALSGGVAKFSFTWYLAAIAHVGRIYGPIAAVAGLMLWLFVAAVLLLFGAELSHQLAVLRCELGVRRDPA